MRYGCQQPRKMPGPQHPQTVNCLYAYGAACGLPGDKRRGPQLPPWLLLICLVLAWLTLRMPELPGIL